MKRDNFQLHSLITIHKHSCRKIYQHCCLLNFHCPLNGVCSLLPAVIYKYSGATKTSMRCMELETSNNNRLQFDQQHQTIRVSLHHPSQFTNYTNNRREKCKECICYKRDVCNPEYNESFSQGISHRLQGQVLWRKNWDLSGEDTIKGLRDTKLFCTAHCLMEFGHEIDL